MVKYIFLGIIQGVTEFLPVSSSAHLIILQRLLRISGNEVAMSVILHLGTALSLLIYFFKDILKLFGDIKLLALIIIVTIITGIIGISGKEFFESLFTSYKLAAVALIATGTILILTKKFMDGKRLNLNIKDASLLGLMQGLAIIPGISRSGITISTLLFRKIDRQTCFKLSFLASIPAIFGATLVEARKIDFVLQVNLINLIVGFIFSLLTGLISLWVLKLVLRKARLYYFGYYCIFAAVVTLIFLR